MRLLIFVAIILYSCNCFSQVSKEDKNAILKTMKTQEECWNKGNLNCFMDGYWNSDSLKFIGKNGLNFGWQQTLDNYISSYPTDAKMGKLSFDIISLEYLGKEHILLIGKWKLDRMEGELKGHYTLIWKKIKEEWKIINDHSS